MRLNANGWAERMKSISLGCHVLRDAVEKEAGCLTVVVCVIADTLRRNVAGVTDGGSVHSIRITYFLQSYRGHSGGGKSEGKRSVGTKIQCPSVRAEVFNACFLNVCYRTYRICMTPLAHFSLII